MPCITPLFVPFRIANCCHCNVPGFIIITFSVLVMFSLLCSVCSFTVKSCHNSITFLFAETRSLVHGFILCIVKLNVSATIILYEMIHRSNLKLLLLELYMY
jgi:hypothetical protein